MPVKKKYNSRHKLTWVADRKCWKKFHRRRTYYLAKGQCKSKQDQEGYGLALREWTQILFSLPPTSKALSVPLSTQDDFGPLSIGLATNYRNLGKHVKTTAPTGCDLPKDVAGLVEVFLAEFLTLANAGQLSMAMYDDVRHRLRDFVGYCEHIDATAVADLSNGLLSGYRQTQLSLLGVPKSDGGISPISARKRLQFVARFIHWAVEHEALDSLPRNINRKFTAVKVAPPNPTFFTVDQVQALLRESIPLLRACILLGLNAGFTQMDVATLEHSHIDWDSGILKRPRNKTGIDSEFVLWPETLAAIQAVQSNPKKSKLMILAPDGTPLVKFRSVPDGPVGKIDGIGSRFARLLKKAGVTTPGLGFKHFRKTSADLIAQKFPPHNVDKFLAHVSSSMRRHYSNEHLTEEFRAALEYLRATYLPKESTP